MRSPASEKTAAYWKQKRCDWAHLTRSAGRFLEPSQLSLYLRMGREQKGRMLKAWTKAAEQNEATFRRVFGDALGFEPVGARESPREEVADRPSGSSGAAPAADGGACGSPPQAQQKKVATLDFAVARAVALRDKLQCFINDLDGREMYRSLLVCAEKYLKDIEGNLAPQARLLRVVESHVRQAMRVLPCTCLSARRLEAPQFESHTETQAKPRLVRVHLTILRDDTNFQELLGIASFFATRRKRLLRQLR